MKPCADYSFVRGVCAAPAMPDLETGDKTRMMRDIALCEHLQLNSTRFWMDQEHYEKNPEKYVAMIKDYVHTCYEHGITSMPILWNGNFIRSFTPPTEAEWDKMRVYATAIINALRDEPGLLMWDVINEPMCNDYMNAVVGTEEYEVRFNLLKDYIRRQVALVRELDPVNCITVGHENWRHCRATNDLVDVICFHDYTGTRKEMEGAIMACEDMSKQLGKPILNTETGCVGRANPYDIELELCQKHHVGWYLFLLTHEGFWSDIHGLVYPDGTIRDPAVIAAIFGFFRNRTPERIRVNANKEGHAYRAVKAVEDVLRIEPTTLFMSKEKTVESIMDAAEYCVNLLECAEFVPMWDPPSAQLECMRRWDWDGMDDFQRREAEWKVKQFAYEMAELVKKNCMF